ncbi:MAG: exopolysaccharide biosynthesis polyprenyl glycosylphosphotransferase [Prevotella sp.]|nr:exopolysaccharide biosynthesis polyprenyl glycosylphosphotransferase [Prevotella sp.]
MKKDRYHGNDLIRIAIIIGDFLLLNLLVYLCLEQFDDKTPDYFMDHNAVVVMVANFAMLVAEYFFNTIVYHRRLSVIDLLRRVFMLSATQSALMFFLLRSISRGGGFFKFMYYFAGFLFIALLLARLIERGIILYLRSKGKNTQSILFVGNDPANLMLYHDMLENSSAGTYVKGYYADEPIENAPEQFVHLGNLQQLNAQMEEDKDKTNLGIDLLFCCLSHDESAFINRVIHFCDNHVVHFYYVPRMSGNLHLRLIPELYGDVTLFTNRREPLTFIENKFLKRTFDIVVSALTCLVLLPFLPIIALIIKMQSPGPLFFVQNRTGLNGHTFKCYKFRSMHVNNQADTLQATKDDPRKFPFGEFMRKTNIDEFPQFFNVLKGDMSIVGPRPHMMLHTEMYGKLIDKYMVRHFCRPGITGWAQVTGFRGETKELWQMEERIRRDIWYLENWTFWLDLKIILKTALTIIRPDKQAY